MAELYGKVGGYLFAGALFLAALTTAIGMTSGCAEFFVDTPVVLSLIHISEPTRLALTPYAVFCLKKKKSRFLLQCIVNARVSSS